MAKIDADDPVELPPLFIRERMKKLGVTGDTVAERMGTTAATVSRLLTGKRKMSLEWLYAFSKALSVPIVDLFSAPGESEAADSGDAALRGHLLALGVDRAQLQRLTDIINTFVPASARSEQSPSDDQSQPASRRRVSEPSR